MNCFVIYTKFAVSFVIFEILGFPNEFHENYFPRKIDDGNHEDEDEDLFLLSENRSFFIFLRLVFTIACGCLLLSIYDMNCFRNYHI